MIDPLPCPFCGGKAELQTDKGPTGELYGWVGCNQCDAMSGHCDLRSMQPEELHPIDAWNTRARPVISDAMVEATKKIAPIRVEDGPDYAEVFFGDGTKHSTQAMTMNPQDWLDIAAALNAGGRDE